jgi:hypothetical protein
MTRGQKQNKDVSAAGKRQRNQGRIQHGHHKDSKCTKMDQPVRDSSRMPVYALKRTHAV